MHPANRLYFDFVSKLTATDFDSIIDETISNEPTPAPHQHRPRPTGVLRATVSRIINAKAPGATRNLRQFAATLPKRSATVNRKTK